MEQRADTKTYYTVFFILGLVFLPMGVINPVFFIVGATFFAIGLAGIRRERRKEKETASEKESIEGEFLDEEGNSNDAGENG